MGACRKLYGAGVSKGRQTASVVPGTTERSADWAYAHTSAAQPPEVLHSSFDECFLFFTSPPFHSSFHLERLDPVLEFLVPYERYGEVAPRVSRAESVVVLNHPSLEVISVPDVVRAVCASKNVHEEGFPHRSDDRRGISCLSALRDACANRPLHDTAISGAGSSGRTVSGSCRSLIERRLTTG